MSNYNICEGKIRLHGRVLKNLKLGDTLVLLDYVNPVKDQRFIIERINAYRHEFDEISEGMHSYEVGKDVILQQKKKDALMKLDIEQEAIFVYC